MDKLLLCSNLMALYSQPQQRSATVLPLPLLHSNDVVKTNVEDPLIRTIRHVPESPQLDVCTVSSMASSSRCACSLKLVQVPLSNVNTCPMARSLSGNFGTFTGGCRQKCVSPKLDGGCTATSSGWQHAAAAAGVAAGPYTSGTCIFSSFDCK